MKNSILFSKNLFSFFSILFPTLMILVSGCGKKEVPLKPQGKPETPQQTVTSSENSRTNVSNDDNGAEGEMPVFKMHNDEGLKVQKVEDDRSNIQVRRREDNDTKIKDDTTPADSLAGQLGVSDKVVTWKPKWFFEGAGGPQTASLYSLRRRERFLDCGEDRQEQWPQRKQDSALQHIQLGDYRITRVSRR